MSESFLRARFKLAIRQSIPDSTARDSTPPWWLNPHEDRFCVIAALCRETIGQVVLLYKGFKLRTKKSVRWTHLFSRSGQTKSIHRTVSTHFASMNVSMRCCSGPRFTNGFSIAIQIRWKFRFTLISILIKWSLQNFVHGTTAVLSWHVQKFVAIWWPAMELWQGEVSIEFELRVKKR